MAIKNSDIQTAVANYAAEAGKPDVAVSTVASDIQDWCEAHISNGLNVRKVSGCFIVGSSIMIFGRPVALTNVSNALAIEALSDLISMRDALAAHFNEALASLQKQKGAKS